MQDEVLGYINNYLKDVKAKPVELSTSYRMWGIDSFDTTCLFMELDDQFDLFRHVPEEDDVWTTFDWDNLTTKDVVDLCISNSTST